MGDEVGEGVVGLRDHVTDGGCGVGGAFLVLSDLEHVYAAMDKIVHKHFETLYWRVGTVLTDRSTLCYVRVEVGGLGAQGAGKDGRPHTRVPRPVVESIRFRLRCGATHVTLISPCARARMPRSKIPRYVECLPTKLS